MSTSATTSRPAKLAFLTTGATAPFPSLLRSALQPTFIAALAQHGYTDFLLQYGTGGAAVLDTCISPDDEGKRVFNGVRIAGFDFRSDGLKDELLAAKGPIHKASADVSNVKDKKRKDPSRRSGNEGEANPTQDMAASKHAQNTEAVEGVVITHAGTGTILEGLRISIPMIVVPNPKLLDNHQEELAEEMGRMGYVVDCRLVGDDGKGGAEAGAENLVQALEEAEKSRRGSKEWPPREGGTKRSVGDVLDEEVWRGRLD
ncbi:MAG: hypothetical protein Q9162_004600 [Coniocarpon cinnabarinum]